MPNLRAPRVTNLGGVIVALNWTNTIFYPPKKLLHAEGYSTREASPEAAPLALGVWGGEGLLIWIW